MAKGEALGIIGCVILQEELLHVLGRDPDIKNVAVVQGEKNLQVLPRLQGALPGKNVISLGEGDLASYHPEGFTVYLVMKTTSLHRNPDDFRTEVIDAVRTLRPYVGSLLLFYGLCRNALRKMGKVSEEVGLPVMLLTDTEGNEVDDCFGAVIGGKRKYLEHIKANHGTLFLITGYAEHWSKKLGSKDVVSALKAYDDLKFVFEATGYHRVLRMDTGLGDEQRFRRQVDMFVRTFDMDFDCEICDLSVFEHSYALAKELAMTGAANAREDAAEAQAALRDDVPF